MSRSRPFSSVRTPSRVVDAVESIEEGLQAGTSAGFVSGARLFQLKASPGARRGAFVAIVLIHVERGDEGAARPP